MSSKPWDRVGIEIEYTDIIPKRIPDLYNIIKNREIVITHDASVESPSELFVLDRKPVSGRTINSVLNRELIRKETIGGELVTPIIDTSQKKWILPFDHMFGILKQFGEREDSKRGSIHVHVNMDRDTDEGRGFTVDILKRLWVLAGFFEAAFFKLGAVGRTHRGENMDFIYYRPITELGPPVVRDGNGEFRPLMSFEDVLTSRNTLEFFIKCGDIYNAEGRYHPCRYMWINFYNMRAGNPHLEFRVFNKTLRWDYLYSLVELCKAFVATAYRLPNEELLALTRNRVVGISNPPNKENDAEYFNDLIQFLNIEDENVTSTLTRIWDSSEYPEYINDRVYSHLMGRTACFHSMETMEIAPKLLNKDEQKYIRNPKYFDIHNLQGETIFPGLQRG
jgi:hypothetical protein